MRTLTIAGATWREAIRQPVAILILALMAVAVLLSPYLTFSWLNPEARYNAIRQMAVASTLMCGIAIAVFAGSQVLAEEIENRTVLTLLAKPVRRWEIVLGKFAGVLLALGAAFLVMIAVSFFAAWWAEAEEHIEKPRTNPARAIKRLPALATGQSSLVLSDTYREAAEYRKDGHGADYLQSLGDVMLLTTGQTSLIVARAPLAIPGPKDRNAPSPGLINIVADLLTFLRARSAVMAHAFILAFAQVAVMAAVSIAVSTRLPLVFNALISSAVFILGNLSRTLGQALLESGGGEGVGALLLRPLVWLAAALCYLLPNFENFNLTETLSVGDDRVSLAGTTGAICYSIVFSIMILAIAAYLFRQREVT